jgi:hypothetical protein
MTTTWAWGDADCNEVVNVSDIMLMIKGYQGDFSSATLQNLDQAPCVVEGVIGLDDIMAGIAAYQGDVFVNTDKGCPSPCAP